MRYGCIKKRTRAFRAKHPRRKNVSVVKIKIRIGEGGFEPPISRPPDVRVNQATPLPEYSKGDFIRRYNLSNLPEAFRAFRLCP